MDNTNINHYDVLWCINKRRIMKLTNKQKRSVKRRVQLEQGVSTPGTRVFVSKKIYSRKVKHKAKKDE